MKKAIAITSGDPSGIGPELTVKAWKVLRNELNFVLYSSFEYMKSQFPEVPMIRIDDPKDACNFMKDGLPIIDVPFSILPQMGEENSKLSTETVRSIELATDSCMKGQTKALCTNPINKHTLAANKDFKYTGHTDFLKHLTSSRDVVMMLASNKLRVVPATIHVSLNDAIRLISKELLKTTIKICHNSLIELFDVRCPKIFVAGLNPHSGENGMFGSEEIDIILPSITESRDDNIDVRGPFSADSLFHKNMRENYDVVICMYHDQALIPIKTISFDEAVNITLGLPFIRTSPDHGTAMDIAGKGIASPSSLINSIKMAEKLSQNKKTYAD